MIKKFKLVETQLEFPVASAAMFIKTKTRGAVSINIGTSSGALAEHFRRDYGAVLAKTTFCDGRKVPCILKARSLALGQ